MGRNLLAGGSSVFVPMLGSRWAALWRRRGLRMPLPQIPAMSSIPSRQRNRRNVLNARNLKIECYFYPLASISNRIIFH